MAGYSDYASQIALGFATGTRTAPAVSSRWLALYTTAPTGDAGSGATEVSGSAYARVQIAGVVTVSGSSGAPSTGSASITLSATAPAWLLALGTNGSGCNVWDVTSGANCGTISTVSGTTITLTGNSAITGALSDSLLISAFPVGSASVGTEPAVTAPVTTTSGATIPFVQSTGSWGTITSWGIYDASSSGNLTAWDFLGNGKWSPFSCTNASPGVLTVTDQTFTNGGVAVVTSKFGGTLPTGSWTAAPMTVAGVAGNTFNLGINTSSIGDGQVRPVTTYTVSASTTVTFSSGTLILTGA